MRNESGNIEATRKGIANIFAKFYKDPTHKRKTMKKDEKDNEARLGVTCDHADDDIIEDDEEKKTGHIPEFAMKELMVAIDGLNKEKSADNKVIKAEDIKGSDEETTKK